MSCRVVYDFIAQTRVFSDGPARSTGAAGMSVALTDILRPNKAAEDVLARHILALAAGRQKSAAA